MSGRQNRRNYYRVLHVQPDAPPEVLKGSYRALMKSLEQHPDRGGDHWNAALINEAYGVLSNPTSRAEYDLTLDIARVRSAGPVNGAAEPTRVDSAPSWRFVRSAVDETVCLFCGCERSVTDPRHGGAVCVDCRSPLKPAVSPSVEAVGRRGGRRVAKSGDIRFYVQWPQRVPVQGRLVDLSPVGLKFASDSPVEPHHIIKLDGSLVEAVGRVAACRENDAGFAVGVEFYTVQLAPVRGTFLSTRA